MILVNGELGIQHIFVSRNFFTWITMANYFLTTPSILDDIARTSTSKLGRYGPSADHGGYC